MLILGIIVGTALINSVAFNQSFIGTIVVLSVWAIWCWLFERS